MDSIKAKFVVSSARLEQCPDHTLPEYAFIGRSNVGKSSLINMLTKQKNLAKTSSRPGKTQLINHFLIDEQWYLVDLPGYGYAKVSKQARHRFQKMIEDYILQRPQMLNLFVLVDIRHEPQRIDQEFTQWLGEQQVPFSLVFTKSDKLKTQQLKKSLERYQRKLAEIWDPLPPLFLTSAQTGVGRTELLDYIQALNQRFSSDE